MRISMVSEHASPLATLGGEDAGGQNVHVAALSSALARRGHDVTVFTRRDDATLPERVSFAPGVEVVHVTAGPAKPVPKDRLLPFMGEFATGLAAAWRAERPDVVHGHFWMSGIAALDAVERLAAEGTPRIPTVHTFHALGVVKRRHQGAEDTSPVEREWLEPDVGRRVDTVLATCSDEAFELKALGVPARSIAVVPCGVDIEHFTPDGPAEERTAPRRIVTVGRLVKRKGVGLVIEALGLLAEEGRTDVELVILGGASGEGEPEDDPEIRRLRAVAERSDVVGRVHLRGRIPHADLPRVLRSADVVVCAPWYEPFGIVPLEAMACGVPVVASSVGGLIDSVVDGRTGLSVPPRDAEAIAAALARLLDDEDERAAFGSAGRARMASRYSWNRIAADTARVYDSTIATAAERGAAATLGRKA